MGVQRSACSWWADALGHHNAMGGKEEVKSFDVLISVQTHEQMTLDRPPGRRVQSRRSPHSRMGDDRPEEPWKRHSEVRSRSQGGPPGGDMNSLDWAVLIAYFGVMVAIGVWSHKRVDDVGDYFTAGGKMPWWLSGISHHMSGYSAVMFTGYAAIAYTYGVTSYVTWSFPIAIGIAIGAKLFAPRLNRVRSRLHVASPLEYLKNRYNLPTQQALAWSGVLLKIVDVGAKWAAIATLLSVFTGVSLNMGILITGAVTAVYCTVGGLWADALTELGQFVIQFIAGIAMLVAVLAELGGFSQLWNVWDAPALEGHTKPLAGPYMMVFLIAY